MCRLQAGQLLTDEGAQRSDPADLGLLMSVAEHCVTMRMRDV